jgi:hypothetical protein
MNDLLTISQLALELSQAAIDLNNAVIATDNAITGDERHELYPKQSDAERVYGHAERALKAALATL